MLSRLSVLTFVFFSATATATKTEARQPKQIHEGGGKLWALLVATSTGWDNYRHQADVCHAYQVLHRNGIPDENIIVMMPDDIANNPKNPNPGVIINSPGGPNVYQGVPIDYRGDDVNAINFLNILQGNESAVAGKGNERVIKSGPNDHIFVYMADHGAPGYISFPNDKLMANDLVSVLTEMFEQSKFAKMAIYVEACESGSMFESLLDDELNIFAMTAADPFEPSYACYYDFSLETFLGDLFSVNWMYEAEKENLTAVSLHHVFETVRSAVKTASHVEEYGDLDIGNTKISEFIGSQASGGINRHGSRNPRRIAIKDAANSRNVPLLSLENQIERETDQLKLKELKMKLKALIEKRKTVDQIFYQIIQNLNLTSKQHQRVSQKKYQLNKTNFRCYEDLLNSFSSKCFNVVENPYSVSHVRTFINICNFGWNAVRQAHAAIKSVCEKKRFINFRAV